MISFEEVVEVIEEVFGKPPASLQSTDSISDIYFCDDLDIEWLQVRLENKFDICIDSINGFQDISIGDMVIILNELL